MKGCFAKIKTALRWTGYAVIALVVLSVIGLLLPDDEDAAATATPGRSDVVVIPSQTPTPLPATVTPLPSATALPTTTPLPSSTPLPTNTPAPTSTPTLDEQADNLASNLRAARNFQQLSVQMVDGRSEGGERAIILSYRSSANDENEVVREWATIFETVALTVRARDLDMDSLTIIMGNQSGATDRTIVASVDDVVANDNGSLSNAEFFDRLQIDDFSMLSVPDESSASGVSSSAPDVQPVADRTYYVINQANLRTCAEIDDTVCPVTRTLPANAALTVTGTTQGDFFSGSTLWYQAEVDGATLYLHSALVSETQQQTTGANQSPTQPNQSTVPPPGNQWTCGADLYNCGDFATCGELIDYFNSCPGDPSKLDGNNDGRPCESRC